MGTFVHFHTNYTGNETSPVPDNELDPILKRSRLSHLNLPPLDDPTRGCVMPTLSTYNPVYKKNGYSEKARKQVKCKPEPDWLEVSNGMVSFTPEAMNKYNNNIKCTINFMQRVNDFKQKRSEPSFFLDASVEDKRSLHLKSDFLFADCRTAASGILTTSKKWSNILAGVHTRQEVLDVINKNLTENIVSDSAGHEHVKPLNVLVFGFDSVSHVNFMRRLPRLYSLLTQELGGIVLDNYNIVGDGTTAAMLGMLAGSYEEELPETRRGKSSQTVDIYPWIFREFKKNGYVTVYAEDESSIGTFQYRLNGFKDQPSDHYMRPFQLQAELDHKQHPVYCLGSKPKINILMDWLGNMFTSYPSKVGKFIFGFHSEYSHGVVEELSLADDPVSDWIEKLRDSGKLDNTILIVMSDHGHRFSFTRSTLQGKYEERLPFFSVILPKWFEKRFPHSYRALQINAVDRLTSPFDIHATLKSILNGLNQGIDIGATAHDQNKNLTRGLSLFKEIPLLRSCVDAQISNHWCACNGWLPADPVSDKLVSRAATAIVDAVNLLIKEAGQSDKCMKLEVKSIKRSQKMMPKKEMLAFKQSSDHDGYVPDLTDKTTVSFIVKMKPKFCAKLVFSKVFVLLLQVPEIVYEIQVETTPGLGMFEGTTKYSVSSDSFAVNIKEVSRVNKYGLTSKCVADAYPHLAKFCYCLSQKDGKNDPGYMGVIMG